MTTTKTSVPTAPRSLPPSLRSSTVTDGVAAVPSSGLARATRSGSLRRHRGARLRGQAATAASCGIVTFYLSWRFGLFARMAAVSGPCLRALRAVSGPVLAGLRLPPPPPRRGSQPATARQSPLAGGPGRCTVRLVALPPKRPGSSTVAEPAAAAAAAAATHEPNLVSEGGEELGLAAALAAPAAPAVTLAAADVDGRKSSGELLEVHLIDLRHAPTAAAAATADSIAALGRELGSEAVVGLDAEWEPELQPGVRHRISVLQLSSARRCWILQPPGGVAGGRSGSPGGDEDQGAKDCCGVAEPEAAGLPGPTQGAAAAAAVAAAAVERPAAGLLPAEVVRLLTDPRVIKAGVGIQEDVRRLERDFGVKVRGAVDVRLVAQCVAPHCLAGGGSLRALSSALLGRELDKSAQRSHWGAEGQLQEGQVAYAAHDAWLSRELLCELHRRHRIDRQPQPQPLQLQLLPLTPAQLSQGQQPQQPGSQGPRPEQQQQQQQQQSAASVGREGEQRPSGGPAQASASVCDDSASLLDFVAPFLDVFNTIKTKKRVDKAPGPAPPGAKAAAPSALGRPTVTGQAAGGAGGGGVGGGGGGGGGGVPAGRRRKERKLQTRKSVLYENCRLLAPDGEVLCTCGAKKVSWYLQRGLARVVSENPTTIQLNFEPRGRGHADDEYYLSDKENRCCVCGAGGEYLRHSVVPHCYRQHFPPAMKSHLSHDIVLMCPPCHKACSVTDQRRMEALGAHFAAPLGAATAAKFRYSSNLGAVRSAGRALANTKVVIPPARRRELEGLLAQHFGVEVEAVDGALVRQAADVDPRTADENWRSHAELVVGALGGRDSLELFIRGWRQHFLDSMRPRFMPRHWRVDARVANSSEAGEEVAGRQQAGGRGPTATTEEEAEDETEEGPEGQEEEAEEEEGLEGQEEEDG
ncbi:hypothetical protein PLESTB_001132900 [Pleodorina starrii]|uniref:3'-5' exonuclease domain-containing protein n=1 Tax=Pleodorina starrii TaxID=330485 RepID=A0A9W6F568_9CHLO|nr:hypothetical protein PLESTM_001370300 [Pleodorina starrii]GLC56669.1 hypothetical protein PLESTB_001132900 [Pleodorina starrii]GLC69056.1 hypothetical protein PLESTF_000774800 [Pleodorina starrii]